MCESSLRCRLLASSVASPYPSASCAQIAKVGADGQRSGCRDRRGKRQHDRLRGDQSRPITRDTTLTTFRQTPTSSGTHPLYQQHHGPTKRLCILTCICICARPATYATHASRRCLSWRRSVSPGHVWLPASPDWRQQHHLISRADAAERMDIKLRCAHYTQWAPARLVASQSEEPPMHL